MIKEKLPLPEAQRRDLVMRVMRGRRAHVFLNTDLWGDVDRELGDRQAKLEAESVWNPGITLSPEAWGMKSAFNGGRSTEIGLFQVMFERWVKDGHEAAMKLKSLGVQL